MSDEPLYSVADVAALMQLSPQTVTRYFQNEAGVVVLTNKFMKGGKSRRTLRIPRSVYDRVLRRLMVRA